jgi:hypothetical protein
MPKLELGTKILHTFSHFLFDFIQGWLNQLPSLWRWFLTSSNLWHSIAGETRVWNFKFSVLRLLKVESCRLFVYFLKKCGECEWGEIKDGGSTAEQQRSLPLTGERLWHNHDCLLLFLTSQSRSRARAESCAQCALCGVQWSLLLLVMWCVDERFSTMSNSVGPRRNGTMKIRVTRKSRIFTIAFPRNFVRNRACERVFSRQECRQRRSLCCAVANMATSRLWAWIITYRKQRSSNTPFAFLVGQSRIVWVQGMLQRK